MSTGASGIAGGWISRKVILAYALGSFLLLTSALVLKGLPTDRLAEAIFSLVPRPSTAKADPHNLEKAREALAKLPAILVKLGLALLVVASVARAVRSIEPELTECDSPTPDPDRSEHQGPFRAFDWAIPTALAVVVLLQLAPLMGRPLLGDELENYQEHLNLPFPRMLTTMGGANNQLGFSILAWSSLRLFGDSPISVRLPAIVGAVLLPAVAYLFGLKAIGRSGATVLGLLLALWPDSIMAGAQGRSYSLLMLFAIIHFDVFKRFAQGRDRRSAWLFAATLAVCCTLHLWFVILAGAEMLFLGLLKVADRLGWEAIRVRTPLRIETFLVFMTLGVAVAATVQAGIMPKFLFVLTQKHPRTIDAIHVLGVMGECVQGTSMGTETIPLDYRTSWGTFAIRSAVNFVAMVGLLGCVWSARKDANARFLLVFAGVVASTFFLVVDIQKPVYLYARFFLVLPLILAWAAAQGWSFLLDPTPSLEEASAIDRASTIPA